MPVNAGKLSAICREMFAFSQIFRHPEGGKMVSDDSEIRDLKRAALHTKAVILNNFRQINVERRDFACRWERVGSSSRAQLQNLLNTAFVSRKAPSRVIAIHGTRSNQFNSMQFNLRKMQVFLVLTTESARSLGFCG